MFPGDPFELSALSLPRPAFAYGVQWLGTDQLLSHDGACFVPIRQADQNHTFSTFESAATAGKHWLALHPETPLGIVPLGESPQGDRLVLILGVIPAEPARCR